MDYTIPFGMISSIVVSGRQNRDHHSSTVILRSGETLRLKREGDFGDGNGGVLIFVDGRAHPEYVRWADVEQVDLDRETAPDPPLAEY